MLNLLHYLGDLAGVTVEDINNIPIHSDQNTSQHEIEGNAHCNRRVVVTE